MMPVEEARDELKHLLSRCEDWLRTVEEVRDLLPGVADLAEDTARVAALRTRALSTMLNVALLGRQSAGKSFLISGLQGGLEYVPITDEDGMPAAEFLGILPSSARPTTACPSTIVPGGDTPGDAQGRALLRVKLTGSGWQDIGTDLPPAVLAAYGAADGDRTNRRREHINSTVEAIELVVSEARLPVKLFDLPGSESPIEEHELIMREAWGEADCFIYVSQARSALTVNELELIKDLYTHHKQSGGSKRVLWVLSGIDMATQREQGQAAWKSVLSTNNTYLRTHFGSDRFIGEGFLPVSAAWEAEAASKDAEGGDGSTLRRLSGMEVLRDRLRHLMESGAGHGHLSQVADETRWVIRRRQRSLADTLDSHRLAVGDLEAQRDSLQGRLAGGEQSLERIRTELDRELQRRIRAARAPFSGLADVLHSALDPVIDWGSLSAEHVNEIDVRQAEVFSDWMNESQGPATLWETELRELDSSARTLLRADLGEDTGSQLVAPEPLDTSYFPDQSDGRQQLTVYSLVQMAANAVGVAGPVAGGAVWLTTSLSLATIAVPVGTAVVAAIAVAKITDVLKGRESEIRKARQERKGMIDEYVKQCRSAFEEVTRSQGRMLLDAVENHHRHYQGRLRSTLTQIMERINAEDTAQSRAVMERLAPRDDEGQTLVTALQDLRDALGSAPQMTARRPLSY